MERPCSLREWDIMCFLGLELYRSIFSVGLLLRMAMSTALTLFTSYRCTYIWPPGFVFCF